MRRRNAAPRPVQRRLQVLNFRGSCLALGVIEQRIHCAVRAVEVIKSLRGAREIQVGNYLCQCTGWMAETPGFDNEKPSIAELTQTRAISRYCRPRLRR